jgi:CheY-like chemotaxis protein
VQLLVIDDSENDAILLVVELKRAGYDVKFEWVSTAEEVRRAFQAPTWDLILCDYSMPGFTAWTVLEMYQQFGVRTPLIVVSGVVGEYMATEMMAAGAREYIRKGDTVRLTAAVRHASGAPPAPVGRRMRVRSSAS